MTITIWHLVGIVLVGTAPWWLPSIIMIYKSTIGPKHRPGVDDIGEVMKFHDNHHGQ